MIKKLSSLPAFIFVFLALWLAPARTNAANPSFNSFDTSWFTINSYLIYGNTNLMVSWPTINTNDFNTNGYTLRINTNNFPTLPTVVNLVTNARTLVVLSNSFAAVTNGNRITYFLPTNAASSIDTNYVVTWPAINTTYLTTNNSILNVNTGALAAAIGGSGAPAVWSQSGSNAYRSTGTVSIATSTTIPATTLLVDATAAGVFGLVVTNRTGANNHYMGLQTDGTTYYNTTAGGSANASFTANGGAFSYLGLISRNNSPDITTLLVNGNNRLYTDINSRNALVISNGAPSSSIVATATGVGFGTTVAPAKVTIDGTTGVYPQLLVTNTTGTTVQGTVTGGVASVGAFGALTGTGSGYFSAYGFDETVLTLNTTGNTSGKRVMRFKNNSNRTTWELLSDNFGTLLSTSFIITNTAPNNTLVLGDDGFTRFNASGGGSMYSDNTKQITSATNSSLTAHSDVLLTSLAAGERLTWSGSKWTNGAAGGGSSYVPVVMALASTNIVFSSTNALLTYTLAGNTVFTASGYAAGAQVSLFITGDAAATRTVSFPGWTWLEGNPTSIVSNKVYRIDITSLSTTATNSIASYGGQL